MIYNFPKVIIYLLIGSEQHISGWTIFFTEYQMLRYLCWNSNNDETYRELGLQLGVRAGHITQALVCKDAIGSIQVSGRGRGLK